jgi:hypothetical protein
MWKSRVAHLEDQLKQLGAGGDDPHDATDGPRRYQEPLSCSLEASVSVLLTACYYERRSHD